MKRIFLILIAVVMITVAKAQPQAFESTTDFQKTTQPAAVIELPYSESIVDKAVADYMNRKGMKGNDTKGFKVFRNYKLRDGQDYMSDLYFKIERKSRKEKDLTVVSLVVGKASEDIKARVSADNSTLDGARDLLNDMVSSIDAYNLEIQIKDQEEAVKKNQRRYDGLLDDQKDYEKKIKNLQEKLEENRKDQQKQQDEVKKQQSLLETLKGKRKSG
jgi:hypothetical protein